MKRLTDLSSRTLRRAFGRYALTATGIVLGVAVLVAMLVTGASASRGLEDSVSDIQRSRVIIETAGLGTGVDASLLERAAALSGVGRASGAIGFSANHAHDESDLNVWVFADESRDGVAADAVRASHGRAAEGDEAPDVKLVGREPAAGSFEAVAGNRRLLSRLGVELGERAEVPTPAGRREFTIVGVYDGPEGGAIEGGGWLRTSVSAVREVTGRGEVFDRVTVDLDPSADPKTWMDEHRDALPGVRLQSAAQWADRVRETMGLIQRGFAGASGLALFVGGFLIYLTLSLGVAERTKTYGTLRALGATGRQVAMVVLGESLRLGVVCSIAGVALGIASSSLMVRALAALNDIQPPPLVVAPGSIVAGLVCGVLVTVVGAAVPARRASRLTPIEAMGTAGTFRVSRAWIAGLVALAAGIAASLAGSAREAQLANVGILVGSVLVTPLLAGPVARGVGAATRRIAAGIGEVSIMHLVKESGRSGYTAALVMVVLAVVLGMGSVRSSFAAVLDRTLGQRVVADVYVFGVQIDDDTRQEIEAVPGVAASTALRFGSTRILTGAEPQDSGVLVIDPTDYFDVQGFAYVEGNPEDAQAAMRRGGAVLLPAPTARAVGLGAGDEVTISTDVGRASLVVAATYETLDSFDNVVMGLGDAERHLGTRPPQALGVRVHETPGPDAIADRIRSDFGDRSIGARSTGEQRDQAAREVGRFFQVFSALVFVAGLIGLLGLANTLLISVLQRTREIGVLRTLGVQRSSLRAMVLVESATLSGVAIVLAVPIGWLLSATLVRAAEASTGYVVPHVFAWNSLPVAAGLAAVIGAAASLTPARRAAAVDPVVALRDE